MLDSLGSVIVYRENCKCWTLKKPSSVIILGRMVNVGLLMVCYFPLRENW